MSRSDQDVILRFAAGDEYLRSAAIEAHHHNIAIVGVRGNLHQRFMAEVDNPMPDHPLRARYRLQLTESLEEPA